MKVARKAVRSREPRAGLQEEAYLHILARGHNTESLAEALDVSFATAARVVEELRKKLAGEGGDLVSVKSSKGWHYEIREKKMTAAEIEANPFLSFTIPASRCHASRWKEEDRSIYGRD